MGDLRTVAELFSLPNVVVKDRSHGLVSGCFAPACLRFVRPSGIERIRWPDTVEIFSSIKDAAVIVSREGNFSLHLSGRDGFDVKAEIVPELAKVIEAQEMWAWIPPAESGSRLAALGLETQAAVVPREGFGLTSPALVALQEDRLFMPLRPPEISVPGSSVATELASVVLPKSGRAVFSAARNEIYIAGGSFRGEPIGGIRVYDFASDGWTRLRTEATFGDRVLALALDAARDRLFVLDVGTSETARLTVVELQTENSAVLWEVPFKERFDRSSLGVDDEGNLVLVGTRGKDVTAWRFAVDEKEQVSWLGRYEAYEIEMLDEIVFRGDVLAIPVASGNSFRFLDLVPAVFERNDSKIDEL